MFASVPMLSNSRIAGLGFVISVIFIDIFSHHASFYSVNMILFGSSNVFIIVDLNIFSSASGSLQGQFLLTAFLPAYGQTSLILGKSCTVLLETGCT